MDLSPSCVRDRRFVTLPGANSRHGHRSLIARNRSRLRLLSLAAALAVGILPLPATRLALFLLVIALRWTGLRISADQESIVRGVPMGCQVAAGGGIGVVIVVVAAIEA